MAVNRGKDFEKQIKKAFQNHSDVSIDRFPDPMAGYAGISNICDFGVYHYPNYNYIECKAIRGNTLNFNSQITKDQWNGLLEKSKLKGVRAGIIVWFIEHNITAYINIQRLDELKLAGAKSLNIKDLLEAKVEFITLKAKKKRVLYEYDISDILEVK